MQKRLTKSQDKILAGVFGGIANYFNVDPAWVRIIGAALIIFTGFFPGTALYIIAANLPHLPVHDHMLLVHSFLQPVHVSHSFP